MEYQGQQHYHPISIWGGEKAFLALQARDARKRTLCKELGITLIEIDYTESLTEESVSKRLQEAKVV
jgi:hypothetical protein